MTPRLYLVPERVSQARTVVLAVNPVAGAGRGLTAGILAAATLRSAGITVHEVTAGDAVGLRARIDAALRPPGGTPPAALVVVGGDGMVHLGLNAVAGTGVPLGIVAAGTGNDIARDLGLPVLDAERAAHVAIRHLDRPRTLDAVRVTTSTLETHWFLGVLAAGLDALVNERANGWTGGRTRPRGRARYVLAGLRELPVFRPRHYRLTLDGKPEEGTSMLVTVANCTSYGGGMRICPQAVPDDGLIDVVTVDPMSRSRLLRLFPRLFAGTHVTDPAVHVRRVRSIRIEAAPMIAYADGERIGPLPVECDVVPGAIRVLAPEHRRVA